MAVLQMQRISITGLKRERKQILELIQRRGVIEITDTIPEDSVFQKMDVSNEEFLFEKTISIIKEAIQILESYSLEKKPLMNVLNGRSNISTKDYEAFSIKHDANLLIAKRICKLVKEIAEYKAEILKLQAQVEIITPWILLDIPMNFSGTKHTASFIGILPNTWTLEEIYEKLLDDTPLNVEIISSSKEQTCIFVLCSKENSDSVSEVLRGLGFSHPNTIYENAPKDELVMLNNQIEKTKSAIQDDEEEIKSYMKDIDHIRFLQDYDTIRLEKYKVIGRLLQSKKSFVLTGYIPKEDTNSLMEELNHSFEVAVEFETPTEEEDVPVLLKNNAFSSPLEGVIESFSPPGKGEIDPTMITSIFYYFLFGLMLSDAGYGAIMVIVCAFGLIKFKNTLENSMRKVLRMYLFCGISTLFWGIMFGSYFGDLIDIISSKFFGYKVTIPPLWFFPVNEPMRMLTFSLAIGIIHLLTGLFVKLYVCIKNKDYKSALYDVTLWLALNISSVILLLSMKMVTDILGVNVAIPSVITTIAGIIAIISSIGIILTNGRESRNPFKRFLKGLYALYGITGYLSDVLSYSRLLALGLATGVICSVINKMAGMVGGGFIGAIIFFIIIIFGHAINFGINALGAYVHTNRLQYVEFYGKFYEGGGRKFEPFSVKTKYYKFKEKMNNERIE